ncbi:MAG: helix-turn-helix domain-containing protein [Actinomycetota bacterium]|nr:helix-turn-helix domain-containing protein [Actinomycetota bacterium]MDP9475280.1 helix-turn-helix domain-containing protein [Actinomycetota bacterium]MDP9484332.1 helix-turn-helix domain-containing protein [Actinomycetota bacterium]
MSAELVEIAARWAYCRSHGRSVDDPTVVQSDWLPWLHAHPWYRTDLGPADNYSATVEHLLQPRENRKEFLLEVDEYRVLKKAVASRKMAAGKARRAKIVLLSNQGHTVREITQRLDCNERTALKWIGRFNRHGVAGLEEVLREGRPRV